MNYNVKDMKALIVDDVKSVREVLNKSLAKLEITDVEKTESIIDAWIQIEDSLKDNHKTIDIIFCDWNMPKVDGIDLLKRIRSSSDPRIKYLKFIMVTGSNEKVIEAMDEGANNIVHKPFTAEDLSFKLDLIFSNINK